MFFSKFFAITTILVLILGLVSAQNTPWRSQLYPENWQPGFADNQGRFLHDFSYCGYHNGEDSLPSQISGGIVNVVTDFGADCSGQSDATSSIQQAIAHISQAGGGIVFLPKGLYRCDGQLEIRTSGVVLRGDGTNLTQLKFTKVVGMSYKAHILFKGALKSGTDILFSQDAPNLTKKIYLQNLGNLKVGDDISIGWTITDDFVAEHNMTGTWKVFNGKWQPFFLRKIIAIQPENNEITIDVPIRYIAKTRDQASVRLESGYLQECGIESLSVGNAGDWQAAWAEKSAQAIAFEDTKDCWAKNISSFATANNGPLSYHLQSKGIRVARSKRVTITDCRMENAQNRGENGNGYLFEITQSNEILMQNCFASAGRHNFIQNWGFGTTGCVFHNCSSQGSWAYRSVTDIFGAPAFCEYHHSLAMACLVDQCYLRDGWYGGNRRDWSSGAGHSVTQSVYWNVSGESLSPILSWQYGWGYIIGTTKMLVLTNLSGDGGDGTTPEDYCEGLKIGSSLQPKSLYLDQLSKRLARQEYLWEKN